NAVQANDNELIDDINIHGKTKGVAPSGRIVNGVPVSIENYKFAVSLRIDDQYFCGESIISVSHVLSAAHCVYPFLKNISRMSVYGGSTSPFSGGVSIPVIRAVNHPDFKPNPPSGLHDFDVAALTVPTNALRGRPNMAPISIQNVQVPAGTRCYVVGWGWTDF
uniref:Peptidase S1 domain-containing protein n=1 Tax=Anopheles coluzzii TaxID=1518534 RepID=A0A6E8W6H4_ANOCL